MQNTFHEQWPQATASQYRKPLFIVTALQTNSNKPPKHDLEIQTPDVLKQNPRAHGSGIDQASNALFHGMSIFTKFIFIYIHAERDALLGKPRVCAMTRK